jgi:hypothetical protein
MSVLIDALTQASVECVHPLDQLTGLAKSAGQQKFARILKSIFGREGPAEAYAKLHTDLCDGAVEHPVYKIVSDPTVAARYDRGSQVMEIDASAVEQALSQPQATVSLLLAIFGAFAHHVGQLVGAELSEGELESVSQNYTSTLALFDRMTKNGTVIAIINGEGVSETLLLQLQNPDQAGEIDGQPIKEKLVPTLRFGAGEGSGAEGSFGHESIERALATAGFTPEQRKAIYFGNWLRDYSQLLDPKLVRAPHETKDFPRKLSRASLTELVDLLALKEFHQLQETDEGRKAYTVNASMLGVYRPSEHIDNPLTLDEGNDPQSVDPDFEPVVGADHPLMELDGEGSKYRYFESAQAYMYQKLMDASVAGPTPEGMRYFGEGLHVLEDLFAHSNFAELSLRKTGHSDVLVWTLEKECKHKWPLVTGLFSGTDILGSVLEPIGKFLFPSDSLAYEPTHPGDRSDTERMLLILLKEHEDPEWLAALEGYLALRDQAAEQPWFNALEKTNHFAKLPIKAVRHVIDLVFQKLLTWAGDSVDDLQLLLGKDPNIDDNTHPTHSQLAKDHDTHPFHGLSVLLAQYAVEDVGRSMFQYWQGDTARDPATLAKSYFTHPAIADWQDDIVQAWAHMNGDKIREGCSNASLSERRRSYEQAAKERLKRLEESNPLSLIEDQETLTNLFPFG